MMIFRHLKDDIGAIQSRCRVGYNYRQRLVQFNLPVGGAST